MGIMKAIKLREQTTEELQATIREDARSIKDIRAKSGLGNTAEQPLQLRNLRRDVARIKTILREREGVKHV